MRPESASRSSEGASARPAEEFLRQALGGNTGDVRVPALLMTAALVLAVVAVYWRRWARRRALASSAPEDPADRSLE